MADQEQNTRQSLNPEERRSNRHAPRLKQLLGKPCLNSCLTGGRVQWLVVKEAKMTLSNLNQTDPAVARLIEEETARQRDQIRLIAIQRYGEVQS